MIRRYPLAAAVLLGTGLAGLLVLVGATGAAFSQDASGEAALSGRLAIAQGPKESDRHNTPDNPKIVASASDPGGALVSSLFREPTGDPAKRTAAYTVRVRTLPGTAEARLSLEITNRGTPREVFESLLFGVYDAAGKALLPGGIPLGAVAVNALADSAGPELPGPALPALASDGGETALTVKVWLRPTAPAAAYNTKLQLGTTIHARTVPGRHYIVEAIPTK
jgi:hypothetical protein